MSRTEQYIFHLYIANSTQLSLIAIQQLKSLCEEHLPESYQLELIDIYQQPELAEQERIFATPTLIKKLPLPKQKLVGDLTNIEKVATYLDLI
ncbi:MAG: circadian clock KaiB family protein [Prochloraceae cyanobacterium]